MIYHLGSAHSSDPIDTRLVCGLKGILDYCRIITIATGLSLLYMYMHCEVLLPCFVDSLNDITKRATDGETTAQR